MDMSRALLNFHGIPGRKRVSRELDSLADEIGTFDDAVLDDGYSQAEFDTISYEFDRMRRLYIDTVGQRWLKEVDEHDPIHSILTSNDEVFVDTLSSYNKFVLARALIRSAIPAISPYFTTTDFMS